MDIREALQKPLEENKPISEKFEQIAHNLFNGLCIQCGTKKYYFAEFEFYYYDKENFNAEWNKKTYPRTGKKVGDLFFHYSGFDICFDSDYDKGVFGGILIRSLFDKEKQKYITGPLLCMNEVLNACSESQQWPLVMPTQNMNHDLSEPIERYGITYKDKNIKDEALCFYDKDIICTNRFEDASWNFEAGKPKNVIRYYHRFKI